MASFYAKMDELGGLKISLQADLKLKGPHRDVLKLLRSFESAKIAAGLDQDVQDRWDRIEIAVLSRYLTWL